MNVPWLYGCQSRRIRATTFFARLRGKKRMKEERKKKVRRTECLSALQRSGLVPKTFATIRCMYRTMNNELARFLSQEINTVEKAVAKTGMKIGMPVYHLRAAVFQKKNPAVSRREFRCYIL